MSHEPASETLETFREICTKRIQETSTQKALADAFVFYYNDLQDVLQIATAHNRGIRPTGLSNEIFSCFHHIARGLCQKEKNADEEITSAHRTHLKRVLLDSYKIAINAILDEDRKLKEILDYLVLTEDFEKYVPDGLKKINNIQRQSQKVKQSYREAKSHEAKGDFDRAQDNFNRCLELAGELREQLQIFTSTDTYLLACAREQRERKDRKRDRSIAIWAAIISAVLSSVLTAILALGIPKLLEKNDDSQSSSPRPSISQPVEDSNVGN